MIVRVSLEICIEMFTEVLSVIAKTKKKIGEQFIINQKHSRKTQFSYIEAIKCTNYSCICRNGEITKTLSKTRKPMNNTYNFTHSF